MGAAAQISRWPVRVFQAARTSPRSSAAPCDLAPGRRAELREHGGDVMLGGAERDDELVGDLCVGAASDDELHHLELARCQTRAVLAGGAVRPPRNARPELAQPLRDVPRQWLGTQPPSHVERLAQRLLFPGAREHQRSVVVPPGGAERSGGRRPVAARDERIGRRLGQSVDADVDARERRGRVEAHHRAALVGAALDHLPKPFERRPRTGQQSSLGHQLEHGKHPLEVARALCLSVEPEEAFFGVRVAAAQRELGEERPGKQPRDRAAVRRFDGGDPLRLSPGSRAQLQPRARDLDVRLHVPNLVLGGMRDRLVDVRRRLVRQPPAEEDVAEVAGRTDCLVPVLRLVGDPPRVEARRDLGGIGRDVARRERDERVHTHLLAADPGPDAECPVRPFPRGRELAGDHRELREAAVRAAELTRVAERLENLDRLRPQLARAGAVACEPVQAGQHARAAPDGLGAVEIAPDLARLLECGERLRQAVAVVGDPARLLEDRGAVASGIRSRKSSARR